jgi:hypothetical protein
MPMIRKILQILQIQNGFWRLAIGFWLRLESSQSFPYGLRFMSEMSSRHFGQSATYAAKAAQSALELMAALAAALSLAAGRMLRCGGYP